MNTLAFGVIIGILRRIVRSTCIGLRLNPICPLGVYIADPAVRQMPDGSAGVRLRVAR